MKLRKRRREIRRGYRTSKKGEGKYGRKTAEDRETR